MRLARTAGTPADGLCRPLADPVEVFIPSGSPTTYEAMRTDSFLYVEYADGEREFYEVRTDPFELDTPPVA